MTDHELARHRIRKLWPMEYPAFRHHLKRLDPETRHARFGAAVSDAFIDAYVDTAHRLDTLIYACFIGGEMRASAELRRLEPGPEPAAEAALAVERDYQDHGLGSLLMDRIITAAQNRGISQLYMICLRENGRMQHIAGKFGARLKVEEGEVTGQIAPAHATPVSVLDEVMNDAQSFVTAVLDWRV